MKPKFSIRDLLWLTAVVATFLGGWSFGGQGTKEAEERLEKARQRLVELTMENKVLQVELTGLKIETGKTP